MTYYVHPERGEAFVQIGEMAKTYGVTLAHAALLRRQGADQSRSAKGTTRLYTRRDRARLKLILLGRKVGFSLRDVKQMIDLYDPTGSNTKQLRLALDKSEKQLAPPAEAAASASTRPSANCPI